MALNATYAFTVGQTYVWGSGLGMRATTGAPHVGLPLH